MKASAITAATLLALTAQTVSAADAVGYNVVTVPENSDVLVSVPFNNNVEATFTVDSVDGTGITVNEALSAGTYNSSYYIRVIDGAGEGLWSTITDTADGGLTIADDLSGYVANGDTFRVVYMGNDPVKVVRVANALAARFIEENMKYRELRASETSAYTEEELEMAKKMLDGKEVVMRDYKLQFYNEMPDQREVNMSRLISLQNHDQSRQESIQNLERTRALLRDQIGTRKELMQARQESSGSSDDASQGLSRQDKLERLRAELHALGLKYKEHHPKIISLRSKIA